MPLAKRVVHLDDYGGETAPGIMTIEQADRVEHVSEDTALRKQTDPAAVKNDSVMRKKPPFLPVVRSAAVEPTMAPGRPGV